jgi:hypothetical protein
MLNDSLRNLSGRLIQDQAEMVLIELFVSILDIE